MTFQYFFFATVPGYFLQALPIALAAGVWYALRLHKKAPQLSSGRVVLRSLFPCYFAGLLVFTIFLYPVSDLYYLLFYGRPSQGGLPWFVLDYDFSFDFFRRFTTENRDNILLFLPFGLLYPLYSRYYKFVNAVMALLLLWCAWKIISV